MKELIKYIFCRLYTVLAYSLTCHNVTLVPSTFTITTSLAFDMILKNVKRLAFVYGICKTYQYFFYFCDINHYVEHNAHGIGL